MRTILRLNPFYRSLVVFLMAFVPSVLVFYFFVYPTYRKARSLERTLYKKRVELSKLMLYERSYRRIRADLARLESSYRALRSSMPSSPDLPSFIEELTLLSRSCGVSISELSVAGEKRGKDLSYIDVKLGLKGKYHPIGMFLYRLSKGKRAVAVDGFSLKKGRAGIEAECSLKLYFLRDKK